MFHGGAKINVFILCSFLNYEYFCIEITCVVICLQLVSESITSAIGFFLKKIRFLYTTFIEFCLRKSNSFCIFALLKIKIVFMKHSFFCQDSVLIETRYFRFKKCEIAVSLFMVGEVYFVDICRYSYYDYINYTSRHFEGVGVKFHSSFIQFQHVVKRYRHYEELCFDNKLRSF